MAEKKKITARIQLKNDTSANWDKATNFRPTGGEPIVVNDNKKKIKLGDGETLAKDLPYLLDVIPVEEGEGARSIQSVGAGCSATGPNSVALGINCKAKVKGAHAEGYNTEASGQYSHTEGTDTLATMNNGHAEGNRTKALHYNAHAEGQDTIANANSAHAEGEKTQAHTRGSHSEGVRTSAGTLSKTNEDGTYKEDNRNLYEGAHAEGYETKASNIASHAEGYRTRATGFGAHAGGVVTTGQILASGEGSFAHGHTGSPMDPDSDPTMASYGGSVLALGIGSFAVGSGSTYVGTELPHVALGYSSSVLGMSCRAEGPASVAMGDEAESYAIASVAENSACAGKLFYVTFFKSAILYNDNAIKFQLSSEKWGHYSIDGEWDEDNVYTGELYETLSFPLELYINNNQLPYTSIDFIEIGSDYYICKFFESKEETEELLNKIWDARGTGSDFYLTCEERPFIGNRAITKGDYSHAEGSSFTEGVYSHAEGSGTEATGEAAHAEGVYTVAQGYGAHAEGGTTLAKGQVSHAEGGGTEAFGIASHAEGRFTIAEGDASHAGGFSRLEEKGSDDWGNEKTWPAGEIRASGEGSFAHGYIYPGFAAGGASNNPGHIIASGKGAFALGCAGDYWGTGKTEASGDGSFAMGKNTKAKGNYSVALGEESRAFETGAFAAGVLSDAFTKGSVAMGYFAEAEGEGSIALGTMVTATAPYQVVMGYSNDINDNAAFIIGDGENLLGGSNIFEVIRPTEETDYSALIALGNMESLWVVPCEEFDGGDGNTYNEVYFSSSNYFYFSKDSSTDSKIHSENIVSEDGTTIIEPYASHLPKEVQYLVKTKKTPVSIKIGNVTLTDTQLSQLLTLLPKTFTFYIDNNQYEAEEGMTWLEWIYSSYNTDGYVSQNSNYSEYTEYIWNNDTTDGTYIQGQGNNVRQVHSNVIIANYPYVLSNN